MLVLKHGYIHIQSYWSGIVGHNCVPQMHTDAQTDRNTQTDIQTQTDTQTDKGNTCHNQWIYWKRNGRHDNYAGWMCHPHHKWDACL